MSNFQDSLFQGNGAPKNFARHEFRLIKKKSLFQLSLLSALTNRIALFMTTSQAFKDDEKGEHVVRLGLEDEK